MAIQMQSAGHSLLTSLDNIRIGDGALLNTIEEIYSMIRLCEWNPTIHELSRFIYERWKPALDGTDQQTQCLELYRDCAEKLSRISITGMRFRTPADCASLSPSSVIHPWHIVATIKVLQKPDDYMDEWLADHWKGVIAAHDEGIHIKPTQVCVSRWSY